MFDDGAQHTHEGAELHGIGIRAQGLTVSTRGNGGKKNRLLLHDVSFDIPAGAFTAIIGPSGCGKTTLVKALCGMQPLSQGTVLLGGHPVGELKREFPLAVGYLAQFGAFHEELTVREILEDALRLRLPPSVAPHVRHQWVNHIIELSRISPFLDQRYSTLSGGQMRRVALAEELVGDPAFLFLDELTSGLDTYSDQEMMLWLRDLAHQFSKTVVLVTHSVAHLELADAVLFLHEGRLVSHATQEEMLASQQVDSMEGLFRKYDLGEAMEEDYAPTDLRMASIAPVPIQTAKPPGGIRQLGTLLNRQFKLLFRDRAQLGLQFALLVFFPCLVAVFAMNGLPQVRNLSLEIEPNILKTLQEQLLYLKESFQAASLVSGLAMFQVILLCLMGSNNAAREIAKERSILAKELRAGLSPMAYVLTKLLLLTLLCVVQSFWMAWFVKSVCGFPGSLFAQFLALLAPTLAMGAACLAISASARSPERASLLAVYLVGLQLPLSGAVLALPDWLTWASRPLIPAYWGWSGYLKTLEAFNHYDVVKRSTDTFLAGLPLCLGVLAAHSLIFGLLSWGFVRRTGRE